jgi:hypothetical protein
MLDQAHDSSSSVMLLKSKTVLLRRLKAGDWIMPWPHGEAISRTHILARVCDFFFSNKVTTLPSTTVCGTQTANQCLGTYNLSQSQWSDTSLSEFLLEVLGRISLSPDQDFRSWFWIVCNQAGMYLKMPQSMYGTDEQSQVTSKMVPRLDGPVL